MSKSFLNKLESEGKSPTTAKKIASSIGRKKYGASSFSKMAAKGRKHK